MRLPLLLLLVGLSTPAAAQVITPRPARATDRLVASLSGLAGIAVGDFKKNENGGAGLEVVGGYQPLRRGPLVVRGSIGVLRYAGFDRDKWEDDCDSSGACSSEITYHDSRTHEMWVYQVGPELMATRGTLRPFAYALVGFTTFNSQSSLGYPGSVISQQLWASRNRSTAYGAGIRRVKRTYGRESGVEVGLRLIRNANATYVNEGSLRPRGDGTFDVTPRAGAANVLTIHVGLWGGPYKD